MATGKTGIRAFIRRGFASGLMVIGMIAALSNPAVSQSDPMNAPLEVVRFGENDTIRGVVGKYLRDPDLWPVVLALNEIASPADLVPGLELRLPVRQVLAADNALLGALEAIQRATAEGARIFAPVRIASAIENRDAAIARRGEGAWRQVVRLAGAATGFANAALEISLAQRDRSAEAIVSDVQGNVEGRAPAEPRWTGRALNDVLVEFERLRTLSASTTQITFRDLSRLRLNANSNATIQRMRSDPLTGGEVTKVSLVNGDFYALLNQLSERTSFEIEVPGIETRTNSAGFWIKNDRSGARFVNYDKPGLEISRGAETITLGENEGVVITDRAAERAAVLNSPRLVAPAAGAVIYLAAATLNWEDFEGAEAYWLEIAADPGFNKMQISEWGIRGTRFETSGLAPARYHWRVAALDRLGLPGEWSTPQDFTVRVDVTPPFLTLLSPASGVIATRPGIELLGVSEPDAVVRMNGVALDIAADGSFFADLELVAGPNAVAVEAVDAAGNRSARSLTVIYRPAAQVEIVLSRDIPRVDGALVTRSDLLSVAGRATAEPGAPVLVRDAAGAEIVRTRVDADGGLRFAVPVEDVGRRYAIEILAPGGAIEGRAEFTALRDRVAPQLALDPPPPSATGEALLELEGSAGDAVALELNGSRAPLTEGRFDLRITLQPGINELELVARDATGNIGATRLEVLLDIEPPEILRAELSRPQGGGGPIELLIEARDAGGLRQAAPYLLSVGGAERAGFARCDAASGICRASLPPEPGALELIEITVEDYAGNAAFR